MLLVYAIIIGPVHSQLRWAFLLNRSFKDWLSTGLDLFIMCLCLRNIFLHPVSQLICLTGNIEGGFYTFVAVGFATCNKFQLLMEALMIVVLYLYFHIHGKFSGMKELMMNHKTWSRQAEKRKSKAEYVLQLSNKAAQDAAYFITYQTINIKFINLLGTNKNIPQGISAPNQRSNASMR